jgi:serine kinase of HPr protein (carbohydrate metabolism regulator)
MKPKRKPDSPSSFTIHASCVSIKNQGVLLLADASGAGKSDLALRLIDRGAALISDDQVALSAKEKKVIASAPTSLRGLIEVRHVGIFKLKHKVAAPVALAIQLVSARELLERLPDPRFYKCLDINIPLIHLYPFDTASPIKVEMALKGLFNPSPIIGYKTL